MKKIILPTILLLTFIFLNIPVWADVINTDAHSYILIDTKTGQVLCDKNADDKL